MLPVNLERLYRAIQNFSNISVLVVGDLMLDEYVYGDVERISPEAPVQVVDIKYRSYTLGGAANVAHNLVNLGAKTYVAGVVGKDENGRLLKEELRKRGINIEGIYEDHQRPTTKKTRIIASGQHILRLDHELRSPISQEIENRLISYFMDNLSKFDAILVSDYAKGVVTDTLISKLINGCKNKLILIDPKGRDFKKYKGATTITPNKKEALTASGSNSLEEAAVKFLEELELKAIFITLGKDGIYLLEKKGKPLYIPAIAKEVYDVSGAGDTVISIICLSLALGLTYYEAASLANIAAGIVVGKVGTAPISKEELLSTLFFEKSLIFRKILNVPELVQIIGHIRSQGKIIVFTNGCFDLIHPGHIHLLKESKSLGDVLIVAIDDDDSVKKLKGKDRPILNQYERAQIISSLDCVDYVVIFSTDELRDILSRIRPDILTKGEDYKFKEVVGRDIVEGYGGKVVLIPFSGNSSSSQIINKIIQNRGCSKTFSNSLEKDMA